MFRLFLGLAWLLILSGCTGDSFRWQRFTEKDFPAKTDAVVTRLGDLMDGQHSLQYGQWTIGFHSEKPWAFYECPQDSYCKIIIRNLKCTHSTAGSTDCTMNLSDNRICKLLLTKRNESFQIRCPYDVFLERKTTSTSGKPEES
jgi:hypothetical protein